jgi:hypothetical protein
VYEIFVAPYIYVSEKEIRITLEPFVRISCVIAQTNGLDKPLQMGSELGGPKYSYVDQSAKKNFLTAIAG